MATYPVEADNHVQHVWHLTNQANDEITIELWTDDYSVRVLGGPDDGDDSEGGRAVIERQLLPKYTTAGYQLTRDYGVNAPTVTDGSADDEPDDDRPEACPMCGTTDIDYDPNYGDENGQGPAWLCTGCKWGQFVPLQPPTKDGERPDEAIPGTDY